MAIGEGIRMRSNGALAVQNADHFFSTVANFAAYTFAPAILVTPLGAFSVLIGAILASIFLGEELGKLGRIGCALCFVGSLIIVLHAPEDKEVQTVDEILGYAMQPGASFFWVWFLNFIFAHSPTNQN